MRSLQHESDRIYLTASETFHEFLLCKIFHQKDISSYLFLYTPPVSWMLQYVNLRNRDKYLFFYDLKPRKWKNQTF